MSKSNATKTDYIYFFTYEELIIVKTAYEQNNNFCLKWTWKKKNNWKRIHTSLNIQSIPVLHRKKKLYKKAESDRFLATVWGKSSCKWYFSPVQYYMLIILFFFVRYLINITNLILYAFDLVKYVHAVINLRIIIIFIFYLIFQSFIIFCKSIFAIYKINVLNCIFADNDVFCFP